MEKNKLSILLPAFGEADNLRWLLPKLKEAAGRISESVEILVLDAESPMDDTKAVCEACGVTWLPRKGGNRYGDAIRTGIQAAKGDYILTMDADGSHNPEFIRVLWEKRAVADVVIASRYIAGGVTENPALLVGMSRLLNFIFKLVVGMPVYDISNSFRLYRGDVLRSLTLTYQNFDILEEILAKIIWGDFSPTPVILEVPFRFEQRRHGRSKRQLLVFSFQFILALFKLWRTGTSHKRRPKKIS